VRNLVPVTLGNVFGGSVLVALVYFVIYRRGERERDDRRDDKPA
jgi:formate/nitrite transporter FocA (FNT family)